ncbi:MAG: hypothetical protein LBM69_09105, partial [Lachnospiraceae bacterium]|nr:hypothetical protein [Lachnospiraceae bacterium]
IQVFVLFLVRCGKRVAQDSFFLLGIVVVVLYATNATFSFQHVLSTPYFFLILGLCENRATRMHSAILRADGSKHEMEKVSY